MTASTPSTNEVSGGQDGVEVRCCHGVVVVQPGDQLVIAADLTEEDTQRYVTDLAERLRGVDFLVLNGARGLSVRRPAEHDGERES
jgi:NAD(P)-dependent dehydrogenase (short-subunit alcohol dehydrogenase family)